MLLYQKLQRIDALRLITYLELALLFIAYLLTLDFIGFVPGAIVCVFVHSIIEMMNKMGLTTTASRGLLLVAGIKLCQIWLHQISFRKGLEFAGSELPFGFTTAQGGWYMAVMLFAIDLFALYGIGQRASDAKAEAEAETEAELNAEYRRNQETEKREKAELERKRIEAEAEAKRLESSEKRAAHELELARINREKESEKAKNDHEMTRFRAEQAEKRAEAEAERTAELKRKEAESKAEAERKKAEAEAEAIRTKAAAEAEAKRLDAETRRKEAERKAEAERIETEAKRKATEARQVADRAEAEAEMPSVSGDARERFLHEIESAKRRLQKAGNAAPTQKQLAEEVIWEGKKGTTDRTIRKYLNAQNQ